MSYSYDLFIFAGEKSGDLHGGSLLKALKEQHPHLTMKGVGGPCMRKEGLECFLPMEAFQVMGFTDVFLALPKLLFYFYKIANFLLKNPPKAILFIDYPGFNLRMAKYLKRKNCPSKLIHFICPSVWAHGKKRIEGMVKTLTLLLSIFPFEKKYFAHTSLKTLYIGNPLVKRLAVYPYRPLPIPSTKKVIAIFPGSRAHEIKKNLKYQVSVCKRLKQTDPDLYFALSVSHEKLLPLIQKELEHFTFDLLVPEERTYDLMQRADLALVKSGTVTLELALHEVPSVIIYGISKIDLWIVRYILRLNLPFYGLVNIIGEKEVFPELFGPHLTEEALYTHATRLLTEETARLKCKEKCREVKEILGSKDAGKEAAKALLEILI